MKLLRKFKGYNGQRKLLIIIVALVVLLPIVTFMVLKLGGGLKPKAASIRGNSGDLWADVILGKRDFTESSAGQILPYNVHKVGGVTVDRTNNHAFIFDGANSRILGVDLNKCLSQSTACSADIVIGQPNATDYGACNQDASFQNYPTRAPASASTVCGSSEGQNSTSEILPFVSMYVDAGSRLFFPDRENHRILIYNNPWQNNVAAGQVIGADQVIGQADSTGNLCNRGTTNTPSASSLCFNDPGGHSAQAGNGVALDPQGNLWATDNGNNRVLRFPTDPANPGKFLTTADVVLGQTNFTTGPYSWQASSCAPLDKICNPTSLRFNPTTGDLYVADGLNKRITVFKAPFTTGMAAYKTFGTFTAAVGPHIGEVDPSGQGLWVNQYTLGKVVLWSWDGSTILKTLILPSLDSAGSVGIDAQNDVIPGIYSTSGNKVLLYKNPLANPNSTINDPDRSLFSPIAAGLDNGTNGARLSSAVGIAVAAGQLFVSDGFRILYWNNPASLSSGQNADGFLMQPNFNTILPTLDANGTEARAYVGAIKADADNHIWVRTNRDVRVYQAPVTAGDAPIKIISYPLNVLGGGQISSLYDTDFTGIVPTTHGEYLYLSEANRNRVLRIKDPLGANPVVDMILGQTSLAATTCNQGQTFASGVDPDPNLLCAPGSLSIDRTGNLYVSDDSLETSGNWRLLMFAASSLTTTNTSVVFDPVATKSFPKANPPSHFTWEPAFDSTNRMVVGVSGYSSSDPTVSRFVQYYNDPVNGATTPTGYLKDFYSLPIAATFDGQDNLYIADANFSRVMIYKNPFNTNNSTQPTTVAGTTTLIKYISQGSDDAFISCGFNLTDGSLSVGYNSNCQPSVPTDFTAGLRFTNLPIPQGAKITNAFLSWSGGDTLNSNALNLNIYGAAADNVATFSSTNTPSMLPTTTAVFNDNVGTYPWKGGFSYNSPKLTTIVQEIVNRSGWTTGNALAFVIKNNGSTLSRHVAAFEGDGGRNPSIMPELVVQYEISPISQGGTQQILTSPTPTPVPTPTPSPILSPSPSPTGLPVITGNTVKGVISSSAGDVVGGAKISVSTGKGPKKSAVSDAQGNYMINGLGDGSYTMTLSARGYSNKTTTFSVFSNVTIDLNVILNVR